ncbi:putative protein [Vanrija pseudolonga]|uniref:Purtative protein n=1 Tax=Vanrija pseudolonga TaxID=143232 RepID=A0AAF0Y4H0_9TREE|nr:purtative protein [Vanrija pseudolonga]
MLENIYIARHGYRADFEDSSVLTSVTGMFKDPPLAESGLKQADELATFLSRPPAPLPTPDALFSSPFHRTMQTIQPLALALEQDVSLEHGAGEWFSPAAPGSGLLPRPAGPSTLQDHFDMKLADYDATYFPKREGEKLDDLTERIDTFLSAFVRRVEAERPDVRTLLIVSHAAVVVQVGRALTGDYALDFPAATASLSLYRRKGLSSLSAARAHGGVRGELFGPGKPVLGDWEVVFKNSVEHLSGGVQHSWGFADLNLLPNGDVVFDAGDGKPFTDADLLPVGLAEEFKAYVK